jgi:hypothetical protein
MSDGQTPLTHAMAEQEKESLHLRSKVEFTEEQKIAIAQAIFDNDYTEMKWLKGLGRWIKDAK